VLTDFMPVTSHVEHPNPREVRTRRQIVRILRCEQGELEFEVRCAPRFDYGGILPHTGLIGEYRGLAHGGRDSISIYSSVPLRTTHAGYLADGTLYEGGSLSVAVTYEGDIVESIEALDAAEILARLDETVRYWQDWSSRCAYKGRYHDVVHRAALTLKALTYAPTGAMVAAPTTSLPEIIGGERNWDYRYTWIRDATFALYALHVLGYREDRKSVV